MPRESILVVEDEAPVANLIARCLKKSGYRVSGIVSSGEEALRRAEQLQPDLVLMDIQLTGGLDGVETAELLYARSHLPVVFLTAATDEATLLRSRSTEAFGYVLKPFRPEELRASVELALHKHQEERKLKQIEQWFAAAIQSIGDAVLTTDVAGRITFLNPVAESLTGWKRDEAVQRELREVLRLRDRHQDAPAPDPACLILRAGTGNSHTGQAILITKNGRQILIEHSAAPIRDARGQVIGVVLVFRDITARDRAESELKRSREQMRALAAHLQSVREEERIRIAREIHDELGQMLTGFKMDLAWLNKRLNGLQGVPACRPLLAKAEDMSGLLQQMVQSVRRISTELRPAVLDSLGLVPALEWQAQEFQTRTGITCEFTSNLAGVELTPNLRTAVFRIFQEALTNVARHAQATRVVATLQTTPRQVVLEVKDNGRGITEAEVARAGSFGLVGMRERAVMARGEFTISGLPGQGTMVTASIPLGGSGKSEPGANG